MEQYGFFVNTDICTGCKACMTSCFDRNNLEVPQKFRKVYEFGGGEWKADEAGAFTATAFTYYVSMTCGHCENPACVANCPTGAMQKDPETGIVNNDKEKCIGCMTCEKSCPYGHPGAAGRRPVPQVRALLGREPGGRAGSDLRQGLPGARARVRHALAELRERHPEGVSALGELTDETGPAVVFAPHRDAAKGGVLRNPQEVSHEA